MRQSEIKAEKRERKKRLKMKVIGKSVFRIKEIMLKKAGKPRKRKS